MDMFFSNKPTKSKQIIIPSDDIREIPRREYDLIEFIKKVKLDRRFGTIVALGIDEEAHTLSIFTEKP
jgi:hypothetical protein